MGAPWARHNLINYKKLSQLEKSKGINNAYNISFKKSYTMTRSAA